MESYLINLLQLLVNLIMVVLILNALMSFTSIEPWHPVRRFLANIAEPILRPFRNLIPPVGMFDLSIMVALIVIQMAQQLLVIMIRTIF